MIKKIVTRTGCIIYDTEKVLEYLYVSDYGKQYNIKADFLGYTKKIHGVEHRETDMSEKLVVTISTQRGCPMHCMFCDCPKVGYHGNVSREELAEEVLNCIKESGCTYTKRFNLHLARMGEPSFNENVLSFVQYDLRNLVNTNMKADVIHPVFTTMLPKNNKYLKDRIIRWCDIKNYDYDGEAGLQLSINSTDEQQRNALFRNCSLSLNEISELAKELPTPKGRKYTLNFPVTKETILEPKELSRLFDKDKFIVKITPIHETHEAQINGLTTETGYYSYDVYERFENPLLDEGWQVIVFIPSKEEDEDRITCGNALISETLRH